MCYEKRDPKIARECFIRDQGGNMDQYTAAALAYNNGYDQGYAQGKKDAVLHGKWLKTEEPLGWNEVDCLECSVCHDSWIADEDYGLDFADYWKYCPNCGSRMDGGNEDG